MQSDSTPAAVAVEYRDISGFLGYRVGSDGSVWTRWVRVMLGPRKGCEARMCDEWARMIGSVSDGYPQVLLTKNGRAFSKKIHILVATAFHGPCPKGLECRHADGNRGNAAASNLSWGTRISNRHDRRRHGTNGSKLNDDGVREIRRDYAAGVGSQRHIAELHGVSQMLVSNIVRRVYWAHVD
jgi:hypothetical protein